MTRHVVTIGGWGVCPPIRVHSSRTHQWGSMGEKSQKIDTELLCWCTAHTVYRVCAAAVSYYTPGTSCGAHGTFIDPDFSSRPTI